MVHHTTTRVCALSLPLLERAFPSCRIPLLPLLMPGPADDLSLRSCDAQVTEKAGAEADEEVSLVAGRLQVDVAATNQQPIPLALLKARLLHLDLKGPRTLQHGVHVDAAALLSAQGHFLYMNAVHPFNGAMTLLEVVVRRFGAQGQPEDIHAERQDAGEVEEPPERDAEGNKLTKKARAALLKAAEKERSARRASAAERMDPEARPSP